MRLSRLSAVAVTVAILAGCSAAGAQMQSPVRAQGSSRGSMLSGVYEPDNPGSYGQVASFAAATGLHQDIAVYYSAWGKPFASAFAEQSHAQGTTVLVQLNPAHGEVGAVAAGRQDSYLRSYAEQIKRLRFNVIVSFGQEMNGNWYPWGQGYVSPASFISAWRRVVSVFRAAGASNVIWLWDVNSNFTGGYPISPWWPGANYVTWVGVDGYYTRPQDTFASVFGSTITSIRALTSKPVLIAETAVGPDSGAMRAAQVRGLFAGVKADHLLGLVWFDQKQDDGSYHQDWHIEDDPAALAAFRAAVKGFG